jgi:hypothetical protein
VNHLPAILLAGILAGCATAGPNLPPPPSKVEVVEMAKSGQSAEAIIQRMRESRAAYLLPASELARLREQGVPDKVIDYMQQTYLDAVRYDEWMRMRDVYYPYYSPYIGPYRPYWRYPYWW